MSSLLVKIIPLALVSTISPIVLGFFIFLLGKENPKNKIIAFLIGSICAIAIWTIIGYFLSVGGKDGQKFELGSLEDLLIGLILIYFAIRTMFFRKKGKKKKRFSGKGGDFGKYLAAGFVLNLINFSSAAPYILEVKEIYQANIGNLAKIITNLLTVPFFLFPIIFPLLVKKILPGPAESIIQYVAKLMRKYGLYFIGIFFLIFGFYYLYKAVVAF